MAMRNFGGGEFVPQPLGVGMDYSDGITGNDVLPVAPAPIQDPAVLLARARGEMDNAHPPPVSFAAARQPTAMFLLPLSQGPKVSPSRSAPKAPMQSRRDEFGEAQASALGGYGKPDGQYRGQPNVLVEPPVGAGRQHQAVNFSVPQQNHPSLSVMEQHQQLRMQQQKKSGMLAGLSLQIAQNQTQHSNSSGDVMRSAASVHQEPLSSRMNREVPPQTAERRLAAPAAPIQYHNSQAQGRGIHMDSTPWMGFSTDPGAADRAGNRDTGPLREGGPARQSVPLQSRMQRPAPIQNMSLQQGLSQVPTWSAGVLPGSEVEGFPSASVPYMNVNGKREEAAAAPANSMDYPDSWDSEAKSVSPADLDGKVMDANRLGQLQHFIGAAREKQERWKHRVSGGNLFKKNQERSFVQQLQRMEQDGVLVLHKLHDDRAALAAGGSSAAAGGRAGQSSEQPIASAEGQGNPKRRAVVGGNGEVVSMRHGPQGGGVGGSGTEQGAEGAVPAEGEVCPLASRNTDAHQPSLVTGWSVLSHEKWEAAKRAWFTNGNLTVYKQASFNMCLRHMGFRPTKGARYGGSGFDWENSVGFVYDSEVRSKYTSRRSRNPPRGS